MCDKNVIYIFIIFLNFVNREALKMSRCKININARYSVILYIDYAIYSAYNDLRKIKKGIYEKYNLL